MIKESIQLKIVGFFGGLSIILGAFGAHALKSSLSVDQLTSYRTGVLYMFLHVIMLLILALYNKSKNLKTINTSFTLILLGFIFFSGSIFLLSTMPLTSLNFSFLGPVTPFGGLLLILGWFNLIRL